ncbi:hypothetical protein HIM_04096 [Hirsutella minnesotensis 3608]|uniref:Uncharacterized protein n=1 Tax=Hirsutella minnesotensis 3608 TaxID=1043627 RepID=A0A0F8A1N9_9HYPO|nr:hypothetical protein HIM_04096 [Hirsutella minnesotensis 3608]
MVNVNFAKWLASSSQPSSKADKRAVNLGQQNPDVNINDPTDALPRARITLTDATTFLPSLTSTTPGIATVTVTRQRESPSLGVVSATPTADNQALNQGVLLQNNRGVAIGIAAGIFAGFAIVILAGIFIVKRRKRVLQPTELKSAFEH